MAIAITEEHMAAAIPIIIFVLWWLWDNSSKKEHFGRFSSYGHPYYWKFRYGGCTNCHYDHDVKHCDLHSRNIIYLS